MKFLLLVLITLLYGCVAANAFFINFDQATISPPPAYSLTDGGVTYQAQKNGYYNPPFIKLLAGRADQSLIISAPVSNSGTNPDGSVTDRFEYIWVPENSPSAPTFNGVERSLTFRFKILPSSDAPLHGVVIAQFWQGSGGSLKYSPPVALLLAAPKDSTSPWNLHLQLKNDQTGKEVTNTPITVYSGKLALDTWVTFTILVRPSYTNTGYVALVINGTLVGSYSGNVGYKPQIDGGSTGVLPTMRVKTGLYRPNGSPDMAFAFNDLGYL